MSDISYFGETTSRRHFRRFGIKQADRRLHAYVIGQTGVGKSALLEILAQGDLDAGRGFTLIDPHGDLVERLLPSVAAARPNDLVYLDLTNPAQPYGYNPLRRIRDDKIPLAVSGLLETMRKLWPLAWGVRMEHVLRNSLYALLERESSTLPDVLRLYADKAFRRAVTARVRNPVVRAYWRNEYEQMRFPAEAVGPIQNKLGALLADPTLYRVLVAPAHDLHFRTIMDQGQVLLVNLAKGRIGEDAAALFGGLLVSTLGLAGFSRAEVPAEARVPHALFVDEFQTFTTLSFVTMLSELRKSAVSVVLANQYLAALEPEIRHAVLGNVGTVIAFRVGAEDAPAIAHQFAPVFGTEDVMNLPNLNFYIRLMIDGTPSRPFSARLRSPSSPGYRQ